MESKKTLFAVLFFMATISFSQTIDEKIVYGKISVDSIVVEGVNVVNSSTGKSTITDKDGFFSIMVKVDDVLFFSAINLETFQKKVGKHDLLLDVIKIDMIVKKVMLNEVIVNKNHDITAEKLGVVPYGQRKYTPAERRLKTAGDFKPIHLLGLLGGGLALDPVINKINGRTKKLKKELKVEEKEACLLLLENMFDTSYYVEKLKIPSSYIKGFRYYILENERFVVLLKSKEKTNAEFIMIELATQYNEMIPGEK